MTSMQITLYISYIFAFFTSLWFGNFITSFYFRIPRGIPLNGKTHPPMCSTCNTRLKYPDYGPLYYYVFRAKFCKICKSPISPEYFFIELCTALICISVFAVHGVSEKSCLMVFVTLAYILTYLINTKHGVIPEKALWITLTAVLPYTFWSLKFEPSILYTIIIHLPFGFCFGMILQRFILKKQLPEGYMPMLAMISITQTQGMSVLLFGLMLVLITTFRKIDIKHFMNGMLATSLVLVIMDVSFPYLSLN